jgi:hypothetical protein
MEHWFLSMAIVNEQLAAFANLTLKITSTRNTITIPMSQRGVENVYREQGQGI